MASTALIGLGSNLGNRRAWLEGAITALDASPGVHVVRVSSFRETEPVGGPAGQGPYLNAAVAVETTLDPAGLHRTLQTIEKGAGRTRSVRWGERTLDLDLLLFDDRIIETEDLIVPHPRMNERIFVMEPLAEIAPEAIEPRTGRSVSEILSQLVGDRPTG